MKINELPSTLTSNKKRKRRGRGAGSGLGKTAGRGVKGQKSRSGVAIKSFEGGQMPLYRRLPKRGFKSNIIKKIAIINISDLNSFIKNKKIDSNSEINLKYLVEKKIIRKKYDKLKILGKGDVKEKLKISTNLISKSAKTKIESAGGSVIIIDKKKEKVKK